ncbi:hypothetical protein AMECASPLE_032841 [Ameca splendens]|uniref:Uncharacterized protein n=1 Tax=Ameca splendens TaxID=208324 RepID=A0ABV0Z5I5_9TELE
MADPDIPPCHPTRTGLRRRARVQKNNHPVGEQATKYKPQGQIKSSNWVGDQEACDEGAGDQEVCDKEAGDERADDQKVCGGAGDEGTDGQAASDDQALPGRPRSGGRPKRVEDP